MRVINYKPIVVFVLVIFGIGNDGNSQDSICLDNNQTRYIYRYIIEHSLRNNDFTEPFFLDTVSTEDKINVLFNTSGKVTSIKELSFYSYFLEAAEVNKLEFVQSLDTSLLPSHIYEEMAVGLFLYNNKEDFFNVLVEKTNEFVFIEFDSIYRSQNVRKYFIFVEVYRNQLEFNGFVNKNSYIYEFELCPSGYVNFYKWYKYRGDFPTLEGHMLLQNKLNYKYCD